MDERSCCWQQPGLSWCHTRRFLQTSVVQQRFHMTATSAMHHEPSARLKLTKDSRKGLPWTTWSPSWPCNGWPFSTPYSHKLSLRSGLWTNNKSLILAISQRYHQKHVDTLTAIMAPSTSGLHALITVPLYTWSTAAYFTKVISQQASVYGRNSPIRTKRTINRRSKTAITIYKTGHKDFVWESR